MKRREIAAQARQQLNCLFLQADQPLHEGLDDGVLAAVGAQLGHGVAQVKVDRAFCNVQHQPDLPGCLAHGRPLQAFAFAPREKCRRLLAAWLQAQQCLMCVRGQRR